MQHFAKNTKKKHKKKQTLEFNKMKTVEIFLYRFLDVKKKKAHNNYG